MNVNEHEKPSSFTLGQKSKQRHGASVAAQHFTVTPVFN